MMETKENKSYFKNEAGHNLPNTHKFNAEGFKKALESKSTEVNMTLEERVHQPLEFTGPIEERVTADKLKAKLGEAKLLQDRSSALRFKKIRKVKSPVRANPTDAGIDFFIPFDLAGLGLPDQNYSLPISITQSTRLKVEAHKSILIPSGIIAQLPNGFALIAFNKSGICTKTGLSVGAEVVDEGYQGEIHIHLINNTNNRIFLEAGQKVVQFILVPMFYADVIEDNNIHQKETSRGDGGFGSTDKGVAFKEGMDNLKKAIASCGVESDLIMVSQYETLMNKHGFKDTQDIVNRLNEIEKIKTDGRDIQFTEYLEEVRWLFNNRPTKTLKATDEVEYREAYLDAVSWDTIDEKIREMERVPMDERDEQFKQELAYYCQEKNKRSK